MFKPYEIHDERERLEVDHKLYLQSPESRTSSSFSWNLFYKLNSLELNDLLHEAAFKGGLSRALSLSPDMMKKLSHRQVNDSFRLEYELINISS
jgi:hypothetical protein